MDLQNDFMRLKEKNMFIPICVIQSICIAVILITLVILKLFFKPTYTKTADWIGKNIFEQTKITATFDEESK